MIKRKQWKQEEKIYRIIKIDIILLAFHVRMPIIYSHTFYSDGNGPWWGIRCSKNFYQDMLRQLDDSTRCFVYITNISGDTFAIAVEGPYTDDIDDNIVFVPSWVLERMNLSEGDEIMMDPITEPLPTGESISIRPFTSSTIEGPIFIEGLTEALNQLGVIQEGSFSAIVDPSTSVLHEFIIEKITPMCVCLADGELRVEFEHALDYIEARGEVEAKKEPENEGIDEEFFATLPPLPSIPSPFSGRGRRVDGKDIK